MKTIINKSDQGDGNNFGYKIPDNYFEELSSSVAEKTYQNGQFYRIKINFSKYKIAASLALIFCSSIILFFVLQNKTSENRSVLLAKNNDSSKVEIIKVNESNVSTIESPTLHYVAEESIENAIVEVAEDLNLNDEELIELTELLEI